MRLVRRSLRKWRVLSSQQPRSSRGVSPRTAGSGGESPQIRGKHQGEGEWTFAPSVIGWFTRCRLNASSMACGRSSTSRACSPTWRTSTPIKRQTRNWNPRASFNASFRGCDELQAHLLPQVQEGNHLGVGVLLATWHKTSSPAMPTASAKSSAALSPSGQQSIRGGTEMTLICYNCRVDFGKVAGKRSPTIPCVFDFCEPCQKKMMAEFEYQFGAVRTPRLRLEQKNP